MYIILELKFSLEDSFSELLTHTHTHTHTYTHTYIYIIFFFFFYIHTEFVLIQKWEEIVIVLFAFFPPQLNFSISRCCFTYSRTSIWMFFFFFNIRWLYATTFCIVFSLSNLLLVGAVEYADCISPPTQVSYV